MSSTKTTSDTQRRPNVLVAEDDVISRQVALKSLKSLGCDAEVVEDGREAVAAAAKARFDVILLDLRMPFVDGFAAAEQIRAAEPDGQRVPLIALTASDIDHDVSRRQEAGFDDFLPKPFTRDDLAAVLARWIPESA